MQIQDYYVPVIHTFEFIDSEQEVKNGVKTVLGTIVSSLTDETAREFTAQLPDWLDFETLRGEHQDRANQTPDDCRYLLNENHGLDEHQADALMRKVVALTVQESPGDMSKVITELHNDWEDIFNQHPKQEMVSDDTTM